MMKQSATIHIEVRPKQVYKQWEDMIKSDQMSHKQVIDFLHDHPHFALWYKKRNTLKVYIK